MSDTEPQPWRRSRPSEIGQLSEVTDPTPSTL